jgi:hypothetical protein
VFVFDAELVNVSGVSARVAVAEHEHLTELHGAIQQAFIWDDNDLYSFWLDGEFWSRDDLIARHRPRSCRYEIWLIASASARVSVERLWKPGGRADPGTASALTSRRQACSVSAWLR